MERQKAGVETGNTGAAVAALTRTAFGGEPVALTTIVEAALMTAGRPLNMEQLAALFDEEQRPDKTALQAALTELSGQCEGRGFEIKQVASGWRFQVRQELAPWVGRLWEEKPQRYTRALLETLALIAYRQPVTRGEIEDIRGVSVSTAIVRTLQEREWIRVVGHRDIPGRPAMYATTRQFLDYFNLSSLDALPPLAELRDLDLVAREIEGGDGTASATASAETGDGQTTSAAELLTVDASQAFQEQGEERIEKLFSELDAMEDGLKMDYSDGLDHPVPASEASSTDAVEPSAPLSVVGQADPADQADQADPADPADPADQTDQTDQTDQDKSPEQGSSPEQHEPAASWNGAADLSDEEDDDTDWENRDALSDIMDEIFSPKAEDDDRESSDPLQGL